MKYHTLSSSWLLHRCGGMLEYLLNTMAPQNFFFVYLFSPVAMYIKSWLWYKTTGGETGQNHLQPTSSRLIYHGKKGVVITTDSLLSQIQMSEHNSLLCGGELHDNFYHILSQLSSHYHTILAIDSVIHASNWFTHLQQKRLFLLCINTLP